MSDGSYVESSGRSFSSSSTVSERGPIAIDLNVVSCSVLTDFLVILGSKAVEEAPFSSQIVLDTDVRFDLCRVMFKDRSNGVFRINKKKRTSRPQSLDTLIGGHFSPAREIDLRITFNVRKNVHKLRLKIKEFYCLFLTINRLKSSLFQRLLMNGIII